MELYRKLYAMQERKAMA